MAENIREDFVIKYQELCRPKIEELLGTQNYQRCCQAMLEAYEDLIPALPTIQGKKNRSTFYASAPFMFCLYHTLLGEFDLGQEQSLDLLRQITGYKVRRDWKKYKVRRFVMAHAAGYELFRKMTLMGFHWEQGDPYGWAAEYPESEAYVAVNITQCGLVKWFTEQGVPEIAPIACEGDFIWAEFMKGLALERTETIAEGGRICDFRYVKIED